MPNIDQEAAPQAGTLRVGIELEGVGCVKTTWDGDAQTIVGNEAFHHVFKRTPLTRSDSFNEATGRGIYITPEDSETFGTHSPAELVSNPHAFTETGLNHLQESVKKSVTAFKGIRKKNQLLSLEDKRSPVNDQLTGQTATSNYEYSKYVIGRNLQTTIGVAVVKLLSKTPSIQNQAIQTLILEEDKRAYVSAIGQATVRIQQALCAINCPLQLYTSKPQILGLRLSIFMYLISLLAGVCTKRGWSKDTFGANFKGYSSFIGCGAADNNEILSALYAVDNNIKNEIETLIKQAAAASHDAPDWLTNTINSDLDLNILGKPGLSTQTAVEKWFSIPNFYVGQELYTVIECREGSCAMNLHMANFLKKEIPANVFINHIKGPLHTN